MIQEGREGFAGWIRTTWLPLTERIPEHDRDLFVSEMIDAYLMKFSDGQGGVGAYEDGTARGGSGQALSMAGTSVIDQGRRVTGFESLVLLSFIQR